MNSRNRMKTLLTAALAGAALCRSAGAEEAMKPWKNAAEVSVISSNGNSKATTTSANELFTYEWTKVKLEVFGKALGSSNQSAITSEEYSAGQKLDFKVSDRNYVYERFKWEKNRFAGFQNRYDGGAGLGRKLIDLPKDKVETELGAGYINEERTNAPRNDFTSGRAYAKYKHLFHEKTYFTQDAEYLHNFEDADGYRLNTETAIVAAITDIVGLKASYIWNRVGKPAAGFAKDDTKVTVGLLVSY